MIDRQYSFIYSSSIYTGTVGYVIVDADMLVIDLVEDEDIYPVRIVINRHTLELIGWKVLN